jgi:hypothetical protein
MRKCLRESEGIFLWALYREMAGPEEHCFQFVEEPIPNDPSCRVIEVFVLGFERAEGAVTRRPSGLTMIRAAC